MSSQHPNAHVFRETTPPPGREDFKLAGKGGLSPLPPDLIPGKSPHSHKFRDDRVPPGKKDFKVTRKGSLRMLPMDTTPSGRSVHQHSFRDGAPSSRDFRVSNRDGGIKPLGPDTSRAGRGVHEHTFREKTFVAQDWKLAGRGDSVLRPFSPDLTPSPGVNQVQFRQLGKKPGSNKLPPWGRAPVVRRTTDQPNLPPRIKRPSPQPATASM